MANTEGDADVREKFGREGWLSHHICRSERYSSKWFNHPFPLLAETFFSNWIEVSICANIWTCQVSAWPSFCRFSLGLSYDWRHVSTYDALTFGDIMETYWPLFVGFLYDFPMIEEMVMSERTWIMSSAVFYGE